MNYKEKLLVWLSIFDFLSYKKKLGIYSVFENKNIFKDFRTNYAEVSSFLDGNQFDIMQKACDEEYLDKYILNLQASNLILITKASENYPNRFENIDNPPLVLYCKGNVSLLENEMNIAIVGTRHPSIYGKNITEKFARELTLNNFCIISGLADGVDTISHKTCLENNGKTIAVIASGFNNIYPSGNKKLVDEIISKDGLVITEKSPNEKAFSYDFPVRNRLIAALSEGVLITEAGLKSGTMHTRDYAINYSKELFAVPGNITNSSSEGCNRIIRELPSTMVLDVNDILQVFNKPKYKQPTSNMQLSIDEAVVFNILKNGEMTFDEILINSNFDVKTLSMLLTTLNFRGIIKKLAGNVYSL